jgi:hypothetical protein
MHTSRRIVFLLLLASVLCFRAGNAQDRGFGLGVILGEPTGISFKGWMSSSSAIDGGVAWSFVRGSAFHVHIDYLLHSFDAIHAEDTKVPLYYGVGGRIKSADREDAKVGIRGVIGIAYFVPSAPIDIFLEVAPVLDLTPATDVTVNAGLGARYFFP